MFKKILDELNHHAPFTVIGAILGMLFMGIVRGVPEEATHVLFYVAHPGHVFMSAYVTASMFQLKTCTRGRHECNIPLLFFVGYVGAIGIATLSDSLIPFIGELLLGLPDAHPHIGFIEKWWLVNPLAITGILLAYFFPATKFPHASHVLLSTFASLFHIMMAVGESVSVALYLSLFIFLFLAVWVPCCLSDIIFPMLFVKEERS